MIVVVIIGVLAAVSILAFIKFIHRAYTAEAFDYLSVIYRNSCRYVLDSGHVAHERGALGKVLGDQFPRDEGPSPAIRCCTFPDGKCTPNDLVWEPQTWKALDFNISDPHRFQYVYDSDGFRTTAVFTARAMGDFNCDAVTSTYERCGFITTDLHVQGSRGVYYNRPME